MRVQLWLGPMEWLLWEFAWCLAVPVLHLQPLRAADLMLGFSMCCILPLMMYLLYERWLCRHFQRIAGQRKTRGHKDEAQASRVPAGAEAVEVGGIGEKVAGQGGGASGGLPSSSGSSNQPPCKGVQGTAGTSPGTPSGAGAETAQAAVGTSATTPGTDLQTSRFKFVYKRPRQRLVRKRLAIKVGAQLVNTGAERLSQGKDAHRDKSSLVHEVHVVDKHC